MKNLLSPLFLLLVCPCFLFAQAGKDNVLQNLEDHYDHYSKIALQIWDLAEMGYQEEKSSALLQATLADAGFRIQKGVAQIPTAFIAEYGSGSPVIAILGEYDALPGLSQEAIAEKKSAGGSAGHACGHHLFGTASTAATIAVKEWLKENGKTGTIRFYGCPAEEGGGAKVYLAREGLFNDVDVALHWHPASHNSASAAASLANISAKFRFKGVAAHAAGAPEMGRSALDAVESMNVMVNMMREHIPQEARIHYVITDGGKAPNVVPDFAEVYYYARHQSRDVVRGIFERIVKTAEGAALGTETTMEYEIVNGVHELLPNIALQKTVHENLSKLGGYNYTEAESAFAKKIANSLGNNSLDLTLVAKVTPFNPVGTPMGSTDVGDVSFVVPTVGFGTATWVPGTPAHSWQAVAAGGTSIGTKGMLLAAKTLALTAVDLYSNPELVAKAKKEFQEKRGSDFTYTPLLGNRQPALDYRK